MNISLQTLVEVEKEMGVLLEEMRKLREKMPLPEFVKSLAKTNTASIAHIKLKVRLNSLINQDVEVTND